MKQQRQSFMEDIRRQQRKKLARNLRKKVLNPTKELNNPNAFKSETFTILTQLNDTLKECIENKHPNTKDIIEKIYSTVEDSVMNLGKEI